MNKLLASIVALIPSYLTLFVGLPAAIFVWVITTIFGAFTTGLLENERQLKPLLQLAWVLHLLGVCVVIAVKCKLG